jgi:hypothetical protein
MGGGVPSPAGGQGAVPAEKFSNYTCTQVSFSAFFRKKVITMTPVFMPVNFGKIFKLQMHAREFWRIFQTKVSTLTLAFMHVNFGKVPNPFDF